MLTSDSDKDGGDLPVEEVDRDEGGGEFPLQVDDDDGKDERVFLQKRQQSGLFVIT